MIDDSEFSSRILAITGPAGIVEPDLYSDYLLDRRGYYEGRARLIVRPGSTGEVSQIVALCHEAGVSIVPQGGNTGLCGGATPDVSGNQIVLCLSRMNSIRDIDPVNYTASVDSGVVLQQLHEAAAGQRLFFPLDLGAKGSCQIGGNLSTNAGGISVLRYGNARDLVLGLEVVLPDGRIWNGMSRLRKDNTGYDLKQLFIGAEGTLGIITAAVLKLFPAPGERHTAFIAVRDPACACDLLGRARRMSGDALVSFEYIPRLALEIVGIDPLDEAHEHYILLELVSGDGGSVIETQLESMLAEGMEQGKIVDGTVAQSEDQRNRLWQLRENISPAQRESVKNDVSVPVSAVPELLVKAPQVVEALAPGSRPCPFGHIGDGNIHYNILGPENMDPVEFRREYGQKLIDGVNQLALSLGGSFSAEHGVGQLRRAELHRYKDPIEIELMRRIKTAMDPDGLLNPGKII
jgi:FAD/FMN-containing dehydrogenase